MNLKPFDADLYAAHDPAKHDIIKWFKTWGWKVHINPDAKGVDLIATNKKGKHYTIEVEVKNNWITDQFKYDTIHIAGRKQKWINDTAIHVTINQDRTHFVLIPPEAWKHAKTIYKNTIYTTKEKFIEIPIRYCKTYSITQDKGIYYGG